MNSETYFLWYLFGIVALGFFTFVYSENEETIKKDKRKAVAGLSKYGFLILGVLWFFAIILGALGWSFSNGLTRLLYILLFSIASFCLNYHKSTLSRLILSLGIVVVVLIRKIPLPSGSPLRMKFRSMFLVVLTVLSFSLADYPNDTNLYIAAVGIPLVAYAFAALMVMDAVLMQKLLIEVSSSADSIYAWLSKFDIQNYLGKPGGLIVGVVVSFVKTISPEGFNKIMGFLDAKLQKLAFWSMYGLAIFRTYMMARLFSSFIFLSLFVTVAEGNLLYAMERKATGSSNLAHSIFSSFFLYIGDPPPVGSSSLLTLQMLSLAYLGWLLFVVLLILVIDIFSSSFEYFGKSVTKVLKIFEVELQKIIKTLKDHPKSEGVSEVLDGVELVLKNVKIDPGALQVFENLLAEARAAFAKAKKSEANANANKVTEGLVVE